MSARFGVMINFNYFQVKRDTLHTQRVLYILTYIYSYLSYRQYTRYIKCFSLVHNNIVSSCVSEVRDI